MRIAMIGLGRMGANMVRRLMRGGHECVVHDRDAAAVAALVKEGAVVAESLAALIEALPAPRAIWIMVPAAIVDRRRRNAVEQYHALGEAVGDFTITFDSIHRSTARAGRIVEIHEVVLREVGIECEPQESGLALRVDTERQSEFGSERR